MTGQIILTKHARLVHKKCLISLRQSDFQKTKFLKISDSCRSCFEKKAYNPYNCWQLKLEITSVELNILTEL